MTIGADQITLRLFVRDKKVVDAAILSNRATMAARILEGKSLKEACALVPLLFSLCSTAQHQAALQAVEEALGFIPSPVHMAARDLLLCAEGINEHATRILVDWPTLSDGQVDAENTRAIRSLVSSLRPLIFKDGQPDAIGGAPLAIEHLSLKNVSLQLRHLIETSILGQCPKEFLRLDSAAAFDEWAEYRNAAASRTITYWQKNGLFNNAWPTPQILPALDRVEMSNILDQTQADQFIAKPTLNGSTYISGPIARRIAHPLISALGWGAETFFAARLLDLCQLLERFDRALDRLNGDSDLYHTKALHKGCGIVDAVRGQLCHRVWIDPEKDIITRYRILAPTEWNFHHDGILKNALIGVEAADRKYLEDNTCLAVMALDPCVACKIEIEETD